jgi:periplasmic divalent cation tolerance protein
MPSQALLVLTNLPDAASARSLARRLIETKVAACVNCIAGVASVYRWQGAIEEAEETTLLIKTTAERYDALEAELKAAHPYQVPEIIAVPVVRGWAPYLDWIGQETGKDVND